MRIVHAVRSDAFAGVERHIALLATAQHAAGHEVRVIGGDPSRMAAISGPGVAHRPARTTRDVVMAIASDVRDGCDILHVHMTAAEVAAALAWPARDVPLVSTRHFAARRGSTVVTRAAARIIARRVRAQIAISDYVAAGVEGPTSVVHPGVPDQPDAPRTWDREEVVLAVQRLEPEKDTSTAIRAFAVSGLARRGWRMEIAGDGALRPRLESEVAALGLEGDVRFLGHRHDVDQLMRRSGILIAPCPVEGLGMTVLEAMAHGLPTVTSRSGGHVETVGAVDDAALFDPGDATGAGAVLARLAADPDGRDRYGRRLQQLQRTEFTLAAQERATDAVYRSTM